MSAWHCIIDAPQRSDGSFKSHLGDREVVYLTSNDVPLCSVCAYEIARDEPGASHHGDVTMFGVHESGPNIHCEECSHAIHSYYGE